MIRLLDINVLIALSDEGHEFHAPALRWFRAEGASCWATCPLTENGFVRVFGHPDYPGGLGGPFAALRHLELLRRHPGHVFLADSVSLVSRPLFALSAAVRPRHLTDLYLLGLAVHNDARFVTFDGQIPGDMVRGGPAALEVIRP